MKAKRERERTLRVLTEAADQDAARVQANQPAPALRPVCDHRGQQPFLDGRVHVCWRCGTRLSDREINQLLVYRLATRMGGPDLQAAA